MADIVVKLYDEGGHVPVDSVTVRGHSLNVARIKSAAEESIIVACRGGEPRQQTATAFLRRHKIETSG